MSTGKVMSTSKVETPPGAAGVTPTSPILPICYFSAVAIAMGGWLWAIGWLVLQTANWVFA
jgi:hypothetical protein